MNKRRSKRTNDRLAFRLCALSFALAASSFNCIRKKSVYSLSIKKHTHCSAIGMWAFNKTDELEVHKIACENNVLLHNLLIFCVGSFCRKKVGPRVLTKSLFKQDLLEKLDIALMIHNFIFVLWKKRMNVLTGAKFVLFFLKILAEKKCCPFCWKKLFQLTAMTIVFGTSKFRKHLNSTYKHKLNQNKSD